MYLAVTHLTDYLYTEPITDSAMEVRMHPRNGEHQRCVRFDLAVSPDADLLSYRDYLGNLIHTFDIPAAHTRLAIKAEAVVEMTPPPPLPDRLPDEAWEMLDQAKQDREIYDMLLPGQFTRYSPRLAEFASEINWGERYADPLTMMRELTTAIYEKFDYAQDRTSADSPIDVALEGRSGVCQDFTHIMLTLARQVGIPARYVSGYLYHRADQPDRSVADASHAWVEAWMPGHGWVGFDPTNDLIVQDRHVRVCVATDYAKASPSRGVFKGSAETELSVKVQVSRLENIPVEETALAPEIAMPSYGYHTQQQQQQQ